MYFSCLASLTQICEISILLREAKPSNQFLLKEKHVNNDLVLKFNKTKKGYFCWTGVDNSNDTSLYSDILQKSIQKGLISQNYTSSQNVIEPNNKKKLFSSRTIRFFFEFLFLLSKLEIFFSYFSFSSRNWRMDFRNFFLFSKPRKNLDLQQS